MRGCACPAPHPPTHTEVQKRSVKWKPQTTDPVYRLFFQHEKEGMFFHFPNALEMEITPSRGGDHYFTRLAWAQCASIANGAKRLGGSTPSMPNCILQIYANANQDIVIGTFIFATLL